MATKYDAEVWSLAFDQRGVPCWHNGKDKATYEAPHGSAMPPWGWGCPPPQPAPGTVVIVGDKCKVDKWSEYTDKDGNKYYHNPTKGDSTWDKPKDFDKENDAGKPAPPTTKPKPKKNKAKYHSDRKGWL